MEPDDPLNTPQAAPKRAPQTSKVELARRVALVRKLLQQGKYPSEIKAAISREFGITRRSVESYITKAREQIRKELGKTRIELQCDSVEFYRGIMSDPKQPVAARLRAREQMDRILGLHSGFHITLATEEQSPQRKESMQDIRSMMLRNPDFIEFQRQQAVKEDETHDEHVDDDEESGGNNNPDPVWEDGDEGAEESGSAA